MTGSPNTSTDILQRMVDAVAKVRQRLTLACETLHSSGITYAVTGDCAVAAWIASVDQSAVRNTPEVELLIRREDFIASKAALESVGFVHSREASACLFLDHPTASTRQALRISFANEAYTPGAPEVHPDAIESTRLGSLRILNLQPLVRGLLGRFRDRDQMQLTDLIGVSLIDQTWTKTLPLPLASRLQSLLDTPDG